jgi:hypothetical protein
MHHGATIDVGVGPQGHRVASAVVIAHCFQRGRPTTPTKVNPMKIALALLGVPAAAAIAFGSFSVPFSAPANAYCSMNIYHQYVCEDTPQPAFSPPADTENCDNHIYNTCPYCKDLRGQPVGTSQPVLPCDHSKYE